MISVFFQDAVLAIAATAFQASDYPVILSFENHCNRNNQEKMAKYSAKAFKEMLLKETLPKYPVSILNFSNVAERSSPHY